MRIASLLPSATEILFAIGAGDDVVGVTHECDYPPEARRLPQLTSSAIEHDGQTCAAIDRHIRAAVHSGSSIYRLDEALMATLSPDLVVTQELCEVCAVSYAQVEVAVRRLSGTTPVLSLEPNTLEDICRTIETVGEAVGRRESAREVAATLGSRIALVAALAGLQSRPRMVCIEWTDPIMAGGHWVPEMVRLSGAEDPLGTVGAPSTYVPWERVVAADPEILVLMPCGYGLEQTLAVAKDITSRPGFTSLSCARTGRIVAVDGSSYFNRPGPRIVDGLEILAAVVRSVPGHRMPPGAAWVRATGELSEPAAG
jgi:iron complex transport system substrate-binding protein